MTASCIHEKKTKGRSNRPLTTYACKHLEKFINSCQPDGYCAKRGNTCIRVGVENKVSTLSIFLFEEEILRLSKRNGKIISIRVSFTSFYDGHGQPTSTTAERINGLLDRLGSLGVVPEGVRLFRDQEYHTTYLGKGDCKVAVGDRLFTCVHIKPDSGELVFSGFLSNK